MTVSVTLGQHSYATPESKMAFFQELEGRLRFGPGVAEVAESDSGTAGGLATMEDSGFRTFWWKGHDHVFRMKPAECW